MNINKNGVWKQNCLHERTLPEGYMQLEYIESNGNQYIDLDFEGNNNMKFLLKISPSVVSATTQHLLGNFKTGSRGITFNLSSSATAITARWGNQSFSGGVNLIVGNTYNIEISQNGYFLNNISIWKPLTNIFTTDGKIILFNAINSSAVPGAGFKGAIYYFKIYENNVLIRDMIPAQRISDSVIGMYDIINNIFYTNAGTGVFQGPTCTEDYTRLEYVQSDGTQYINTGIKGNAKHYYKLAWLKEGVTRQLMGYGGSSKEYWGLQNKNTGKIELGGAASFLPPIDITQPQEYEWDYHYANSINRIYLNNSLILESIPSPDVTNTTIKFLNIYANLNTYPCNIKIYSYIIKDWNNNILAQYIPVKRNSDDKIGLFEIVSQTFVQSGNENNFIAGPNYIQTDNVKIYKNNKSIEANDFIEL